MPLSRRVPEKTRKEHAGRSGAEIIRLVVEFPPPLTYDRLVIRRNAPCARSGPTDTRAVILASPTQAGRTTLIGNPSTVKPQARRESGYQETEPAAYPA